MTHMENLHINLGGRSYDLLIGGGAFNSALDWLSNRETRACAVADSRFLSLHSGAEKALLERGIPVVKVEGGEKSKTLSEFGRLCSEFARIGLDRCSVVAAVGGGVVGDLAGFAASAYMRGIDFIQIPTTLLAMVDSSVGGKTGVDIKEGKNLVGAFWQPKAVFADLSFLKTLPPREFAAGCAEIIKCAVLGDAGLFELLENLDGPLAPDTPALSEAVRLSCALKAKVVAADECETCKDGGRALLNLGHTYAHALEKCAGYGTYLHGEAVAIGLVFAARLSAELCGLSKNDERRICGLLEKNRLPTHCAEKISAEKLWGAMALDKKARGGRVRFALADKIGSSRTMFPDPELVRRLIDEF